MKLIRFGEPGFEKPGILDADGIRRDLSCFFSDWDSAFLQRGGLNELNHFIRHHQELPAVSEEIRWPSGNKPPGQSAVYWIKLV